MLKDANINEVPDIDRLFGDVSSVGPFAGLETEYLRTKYFRGNFRLLVSMFYYYKNAEKYSFIVITFVLINFVIIIGRYIIETHCHSLIFCTPRNQLNGC